MSATSFTETLADILRLFESVRRLGNSTDHPPRPDEALGISFLYTNKFKRFESESKLAHSIDPYVCEFTFHQS
jgi:hypothetical protein